MPSYRVDLYSSSNVLWDDLNLISVSLVAHQPVVGSNVQLLPSLQRAGVCWVKLELVMVSADKRLARLAQTIYPSYPIPGSTKGCPEKRDGVSVYLGCLFPVRNLLPAPPLWSWGGCPTPWEMAVSLGMSFWNPPVFLASLPSFSSEFHSAAVNCTRTTAPLYLISLTCLCHQGSCLFS